MKQILYFLLLLFTFSESSIAQDIQTDVQLYLDAHNNNESFSGSVLIRNNDIAYNWSTGFANYDKQIENSESTLFRYASISKTYTATLIFLLQQDNLLSIDDSIDKWIPDYPNGSKITLRHLLSHTSGIPNYTSFSDFTETMHLPATNLEIINRFKNLDLEFEPGERFAYSNSGFTVLSHIIELVTDMSYADALETYLLQPFGITSAMYEQPNQVYPDLAVGYEDKTTPAKPIHLSIPQGAGGIMGDTKALLTLVDRIYDDNFFSEDDRSEMLKPVTGNYGYGWALGPVLDKPSIGHAGGINGFSTNMIHIPSESVTIIVLSNLETAPVGSITRDLAAIVFDKPYNIPEKRTEISVSPEILQNYIGVYELAPGFTINISLKDDQLTAQATDQPEFELFAESETAFFLKVVDARIVFNVDDDGVATSLTLHQGGQTIPGKKLEDQ